MFELLSGSAQRKRAVKLKRHDGSTPLRERKDSQSKIAVLSA